MEGVLWSSGRFMPVLARVGPNAQAALLLNLYGVAGGTSSEALACETEALLRAALEYGSSLGDDVPTVLAGDLNLADASESSDVLKAVVDAQLYCNAASVASEIGMSGADATLVWLGKPTALIDYVYLPREIAYCSTAYEVREPAVGAGGAASGRRAIGRSVCGWRSGIW